MVEVEVGPLADFSQLVGFEDAAGRDRRDVGDLGEAVRAGRATLEMRSTSRSSCCASSRSGRRSSSGCATGASTGSCSTSRTSRRQAARAQSPDLGSAAVEMVAGRTALQLRVAPPKNMQRACLNWAADYELPGAIAQLGERLHGTRRSSVRARLAPLLGNSRLGAHEFRERFGWYMERAAAGETLPDHPARQAVRSSLPAARPARSRRADRCG